MGDQIFLERFVWFDNEARRGRFPNATRLARQFEIASKTAQRSIEYFRDRLRAPLDYDLTRKGYFYTDSTFQLPVLRITEKELLALLISRKLLTEASAGPLADELESVSQRLGSLLSASLPGRTRPEEAFSFRWKNINPTDPLAFELVASALLQGRQLTFCYYSPASSSCTTRSVEPHHLVNYVGNWYLIAFCHLRSEWRPFMLGRMSLCQIETATFESRPREEWQPQLHDTYGIFQNRESFDVLLRFTSERARWVRNEIWHEAQKEEVQADGSLLRTITASHEAEIMMEVLKHGSHVEVLEPGWLREKVVEEMRRAVEKYQA